MTAHGPARWLKSPNGGVHRRGRRPNHTACGRLVERFWGPTRDPLSCSACMKRESARV